ncbi:MULTISPECIES: oxygenase MpaB family protein [unclassified Aminobacter]|uniref:oxygenase MpaB family protein n=1 Tax=unclassified Aminobacter TaxID=2644704 RepID=UPI0004636A97|nr:MULTISPECIES: oxygenase MpaB family protein [unclassified Aminobacter]TWH31584.1 uncharacterized protein (DUF2236 family) [Aminobacter sp. J15]
MRKIHGSALPRLLLLPLESQLDRVGRRLMQPDGAPRFDFRQPLGEEALLPPDSVSWRIFKNPISLFIGGVAAVILELAEPAVRTGVWEHSSFRKDTVGRLQRTGLAAMITVYGARSRAEKMIAGVVRQHDRVGGTTPDGRSYKANDPDLLDWVQATATFGFTMAYSRYVSQLSAEEISQAFAEAQVPGRLYGARNTPTSLSGWEKMLAEMKPRLEPSAIIDEFLWLVSEAEAFPAVLRPLQRSMVRAAVALVPQDVQHMLGLPHRYRMRLGEENLLRQAGSMADRLVLPSLPPAQSCLRLGLPADYLYHWIPDALPDFTPPPALRATSGSGRG